MSTEQNVAQFRRLIEVGFTQGDLTVVDEVVSKGCLEHQRGSQPGADGVRQTIATLHSWFADFEVSVEDIVADGDMVWARNRARGVSNGSVMGHPSSGTPVEIDVFDSARFVDGKIVEHWGVPDQLGLMLQLGLLPRRESTPVG